MSAAPSVTDAGRLVRSSALVGVGTALSRVTGLGRVFALTYALGATPLADAYNLANNTPNLVYDLMLGGILSATLVPVFVDQFQREDHEGIDAVVTLAVAALIAITALALLVAPLIFRIYTLGVSAQRADRLAAVGVPLLRWFAAQIFFYGLTAVATALLNARRSFAAPAFAPVLNNIVVCAMLLAVPHVTREPLTLDLVRHDPVLMALLGLGTTAGIAAMTVVLWPAMRRAGIGLRWHFDLHHPAVRRVGSLSGWTIGYVTANQVALFVVLALATNVGASAYLYAYVFFQLPHGLFAVSVMTTFVPDLALFAATDDMGSYRERFGLGVRLLTLVVLPSSVGLGLMARPLIGLLRHGAFDAGSAALTGDILIAFAFGLLAFSLYLFTLRGYYALNDTRTPFSLNLVENGINVALAFAVVGRFGAQGLAGAFSAAYVLAAACAMVALSRRVGGLGLRDSLPTLARIVMATALMGGAVYGVTHAVGGIRDAGALVRLLAGTVVGLAVYGGAVVALRVHEVTQLLQRLRRRRNRP